MAAAAATATGARARAGQTVRIGYQKFGLLLTLKTRGTLDRALQARGWSVAWAEFPGGIQLVEALAAGKLDLGYVGEGPPIFAQAAGTPLVYLGAEPPAPAGEAILVPAGSPITTVAQLEGKQVVVNKGSNSHYLLIKALEEARLPYDRVKVSFVPPAGARAAFESKQVDAWSIWDPFFAAAEKATAARVLRDGRGLVENSGYYVGLRGFASQHPEVVATALAEIKATAARINADVPGLAAELAPVLGIDRDSLAVTLRRGPFGVRPVGDDLLASQQRVADTFHALKLIPRPIRVADARWVQGSGVPSGTR
jgi:sulfonate transport system substrate-binding protein